MNSDLQHDDPGVEEAHQMPHCILHRVVPARVDGRPANSVTMVAAYDINRTIIPSHFLADLARIAYSRPAEENSPLFILQ